MVLVHTQGSSDHKILMPSLPFVAVSFSKKNYGHWSVFLFSFVCLPKPGVLTISEKSYCTVHIIVAPFKHFKSTLSYCDTIFEKIRNGPNELLWGWGETDSWKDQKQKLCDTVPLKRQRTKSSLTFGNNRTVKKKLLHMFYPRRRD
jgi:hypothetical protein